MQTKKKYWKIVNPKIAQDIFNEGKTKIYKLYDDEKAVLIKTKMGLNRAIDSGTEIVLKIKIMNF